MERFAIKIDKAVKARLKNLCRLCGIDNPNQIEILNAAEWIDLTIDGEVALSRKIAECVGIQVMKNDKMPQRICALCIDKINDFYEFREMCQATNIQTRKLLNLPDIKPKKVTIKMEDDAVESILGISGTETIPKSIEPATKSGKKSKKAAAAAAAAASAVATATTSSANDNRFRKMTKREIEVALEMERIKKEDEEEKDKEKKKKDFDATANRTKNGKKKKEKSTKKVLDTPLLAPKEPNQRERKRDMEQKRIEKKRKTELKIKVPVAKKIKREPGVSCLVCDERFEKVAFRDSHLVAMHCPMVYDFGCSSCHEQFNTLEENTSHNEWHFKNKVPFKCVICSAAFPKLMTFQTHFSVCATSSMSAVSSFATNIYCGLCSMEFETQNLYDWHKCFIGDNSPCPQCQRIFIKRTVLLKHMFKCGGPLGSVAVAVGGKKAKGKAKKKTAVKTKIKLNIPPQNSFKFEPETIIDQNVDGDVDDDDGAFDAVDDSFMDTHFGDSDNEFETNDSIITPTDAAASISEPAQATTNDDLFNSLTATVNPTDNISNVGVSLPANLPLLECRVKLEPLDVTSLPLIAATANPSTLTNVTSNAEQPLPAPSLSTTQPPLTVPPLTIRIKKEMIRPGYGDEFDIHLARNIKQERVDETYELAGTSANKKSKHRDKEKKLYKKPALLAIKIKQERMEREANDDDEYGSGDNYPDYSMGSDDYAMGDDQTNQTFDTNSLPIITQIHSQIESSSIIPMSSEQSIGRSTIGPNPCSAIPFVPIRIKSEFQRPLSPPTCASSETISTVDQQPTQSVATSTSNSEGDDSTTIATNSSIHIANEYKETECPTEAEPDVGNKKSECIADDEIQQMECDTSTSNVECDTNVQSNEMADDIAAIEYSDNCMADSVSELAGNQIIDSFSEKPQTHEKDEADTNVTENEVPVMQPTPIDSIESSQCHEAHETVNDVDENVVSNVSPDDTVDVPMKDDDLDVPGPIVSHDTNEPKHGSDSMPQLADEVDNDRLCNFADETLPIGDNATVDLLPICDNSNEMDTNDNSNISPIDFIENANDESLNFIDQLVHEVADTIITPESSDNDHKDIIMNDTTQTVAAAIVPIETTSVPTFSGTEFNYNVDCSHVNTEDDLMKMTDAHTSDVLAQKDPVNNTRITLSDIPDIDYDLLPVIESNQTKSNGNEMNTSSTDSIAIEQQAAAATIDTEINTNLSETDQSTLSLNN